MFQAVQDYLQGDNDQDMDIRLSLPVIMIHDISLGSHHFMVCAFLGEALNNSPPTPTDPKIVIWQPTEKVIYTRRVGTRMTDAQWHMEYQNLKTLLEANGKGSNILNHVYAYVTFTPPWTKMADRYEVWIFKNVQVHNF
ncbi:hypothetical protein TCAL_06747 [Tigriopus californicus]|uniref:Uncharacterized protein n=2 Tax=Tigriopus californicus TaxID=6832 RepID=A0A553PKN3_TIGCA|nr:hypothetical protein TCAL_06747 [Tigriopus californicus]